MNGVYARIALRVIGGILIGYGWASEDVVNSFIEDPDVQMVAGAALITISESFYALAKKKGWTT